MDEQSRMPAAGGGRHYGMDWLRIGAFLVLIFYHIGMIFVPWSFHVKSQPVLDWVAIPMLLPNAWRLSLLFVVSGYASAAILAKEGGGGSAAARRFAWWRTVRLLVPVIFGMAVVVPPQPWVELVVKHGYARDYLTFWTQDYFRFGSLEGIVLPTWQHLWFVVYLWVYTLVLAILLAVVPASMRRRIAELTDRILSGLGIIFLPLALLAINLALTGWGRQDTHDLINDGAAHRVYFGMLLFGFYLRGADRGWGAIARWWKTAAALAIAGYVVVAGLEITYPGSTPAPEIVHPIFALARVVQEWGAIIALIGIATRFWNRDHRWRQSLNEGVFPFYIIHQTIIVVVFYWCLSAGLGNAASFAILVAATIGGCWLFYRAGRLVPGLRLLIGLRGWRIPARDRRAEVRQTAGDGRPGTA